ncbi:MAG: phosphatase PAP2 family protein [Spirochaetes bacterium]|nr:phosphatase PAP2 family protein [Spirochaetota bacterium]
MKIRLLDYLSIAYFFIVSVLISFFHDRVVHWHYYLFFYMMYIAAIFLLAHFSFRFPQSRIIRFLRLFYPLLTFGFVYRLIQAHVLILHGSFLDHHIIALEKALLGVNPTLALEAIVTPVLTEFLKFSYFSYYFYVPIPALFLFFKKRYRELEQFMFTITFTFYVSYIGFVLYPVQGPRFEFADVYRIKELTGFLFTSIQDFLMARAAARGACMPSSHLAVAWVSLFLIKRFFGKKIFWLIFPLTFAMTLAIVYNRYHYVTDGLAGLIVGFLCYHAARMIFQKQPSLE